jgi:hypothetical protein
VSDRIRQPQVPIGLKGAAEVVKLADEIFGVLMRHARWRRRLVGSTTSGTLVTTPFGARERQVTERAVGH